MRRARRKLRRRACGRAGGRRAFSSGYDLDEMDASHAPEVMVRAEERKDFERMLHVHVWSCEEPVVAAVSGYASPPV
ncbi:MAG TPA: hypothetical protein ENF26_04920 [Methanomicrobia archaeon]|nr:hypothetical protein [Methanomicrobia archaeon]HEX59468.1 hypothetical protein [Methanomicrobia archaeon]